MARIYISSTYEDLKEYRSAAANALEKLEQTVVAMEDYVASDRRPLDRCLADVEASDVYVGIFAWRYGFIPDGKTKSITELELQHAGEKKVPRLLFVLDEHAPWPPSRMDAVTGENGGGQRITALRERIQRELTVSAFQNADQLATLVSVAATLQLVSRQLESITPQKVDAPMINESGVSYILESLRAAEALLVDLGDGTAWWSTRLFILAALAAEHTPVQQMVFLERDNRYVGMAPPWRIRDRLAAAFPLLHDAYRRALAAQARPTPPGVLNRFLDEVRALAPDHDEGAVKEDVLVVSLAAWLGDALDTAGVADQGERESDRDFARRINAARGAFVPLVENGRLVQVVDRCKQAARIAAAALEHLP